MPFCPGLVRPPTHAGCRAECPRGPGHLASKSGPGLIRPLVLPWPVSQHPVPRLRMVPAPKGGPGGTEAGLPLWRLNAQEGQVPGSTLTAPSLRAPRVG